MVHDLDHEILNRLKPSEKQTELACSVPGIGRDSAASILDETGMDMGDDGPFPSCHHLSSWSGICPGNNESGGKRKSGKTRKGNRWAPSGAVANRVGSSSEKTLYFQDQIPKAQITRGPQRAATAVSHAQLIALYWVLRNGVPYKEQAHQLEEQRRESLIRHHLHRLSELGYKTA